MAAAPAASKLLNISKNPALQNLIRSNILRATGTPISQALESSTDSQVPIQFDREVPSVRLQAPPTAAEMRKMMNPVQGFSLGMAGLPGMDQSERILKSNRSPSKVDDDEEIEDNLDDGNFADDSDDYDPDAGDFEYSDGPSGSDSDD